jgi:A/G-specific adenine glycosylase
MAAVKKILSRNAQGTRTVRNANNGRVFPPLPGERARVRAGANKTIPHSALHVASKQREDGRTPHSTQLVPALLTWFATNARDLPWRRTRDPYAIWVSEIMLQQTQVKTVIPYWERWLGELPTIEALAKAHPDKIHKLWEGLGYYTRVRNMQKAAQQIVTEHGGRFPETFDAVLALPGIGRYTAGAICSIAFNQPTPILDGNVIRVLTRVYGIATDPREKQTTARLWQLAEELVLHASRTTHHASPCSHLNQSLMELGALICTPRSPQCEVCPVNKFCIARKENLQEQLPNLGKRAATTERRYLAFVVERDGKFLVRQRPKGVVNAHLWEFPNLEVGARVCDPQHAAAKELGFSTTAAKPLHTIKHSITRYRITLEAWHAEVATPSAKIPGRWLTPKQLHQLAFTSAHKKILGHLEKRC